MVNSVALVTGATSGLGYAAARMLAVEGYRQIIVTGRNLAKAQETAARLAAETRSPIFTPLDLDLNEATSVRSAVEELVTPGCRSISCCSMQGGSEVRSACSLSQASRRPKPRLSATIN